MEQEPFPLGAFPKNFERHVTEFAPRKALKLIARGQLTFDEWAVLHRVVGSLPQSPGGQVIGTKVPITFVPISCPPGLSAPSCR